MRRGKQTGRQAGMGWDEMGREVGGRLATNVPPVYVKSAGRWAGRHVKWLPSQPV